jgi:hypothetical protein
MTGFRLEVEGNEVPLLSIDIEHKEEVMPVVRFDVGTEHDLCDKSVQVMFDKKVIARGIAKPDVLEVSSKACIKRFALRYLVPELLDRHSLSREYYDPCVQDQDNHHNASVAQFKLLNHKLLDGSFVESDILPQDYRGIECKYYKQKFCSTKGKLKNSVQIELVSSWTYSNCGYVDMGALIAECVKQSMREYAPFSVVDVERQVGLNAHEQGRVFPTHLPLEVSRYLSEIDARLPEEMWVVRNRQRCLDTFCYPSDPSDEDVVTYGAYILADLVLGWSVSGIIQESVCTEITNGAYKSKHLEDTRHMKFRVLPDAEHYQLWRRDQKYDVGDVVSVNCKLYRCTQGTEGEEFFADPKYNAESKWELVEGGVDDRADPYFMTERGRQTIAYVCNIAAGYLLRQARTKVFKCIIPASYITEIQVGDAVELDVGVRGVVSECSVKGPEMSCTIVATDCCVDKAALEDLDETGGIKSSTTGISVFCDVPEQSKIGVVLPHVRHSIDSEGESFEIQLPQCYAPRNINHKVRAQWCVKEVQ